MRLTEEDVELEWAVWGDQKPWYCPVCKTFLAADFYTECDGSDPMIPKSEWKKHALVQATPPVTFEEFTKALLEQYGQSSLDVEDVEEEAEDSD